MAESTRSPASESNPTNKGSVRTATPVDKAKHKEFTEVAVERGYCTKAQIAGALDSHKAENSHEDLAVYLVRKGILTQQQCRACERGMRGATVIAGFEILEKVGQGGMGAVFRARQISMDRVVALKILPPKLAQDPTFKKRFLHEARLSAKLSHLNIINGIDCGEESGYTFFAMEFVDGQTIKDIMKVRGKLPIPEAHAIVRQMGEALVYAHRQGLIHRDIKPDNIMLTTNAVAKLCDLGLAKHTENEDDAGLTQAGQAVGTPHYISPEQARGEKHIDTRSDIYSLGATFYHMLTGKTPFEGATGAAVMALHITEETKSPCEIDPAIPEGYGQIISKMMAKDPANRYATPDELVEDLDALKNKKPLLAAKMRANSSCRMPRPTGLRGHSAGPLSPISEKRFGTGKQTATASRIPLIIGVCVFLALAGGTGIYVLKKASDASERITNINLNPISPPADPATHIETPAIGDPAVQKPPVAIPKPDPKLAVTTPDPKTTKAPLNPNGETPLKDPAVATVKIPKEPKDPLDPAKIDPPKTPVDNPDAVIVARVPEEAAIASQKVEVTADMLYARILHDRTGSGSEVDVQKVQNRLRDLSLNSEYKNAKADINAETADLAAAIAYERAALKALADAGGEVTLNKQTAAKWGTDKGKIIGYNPQRGLSVTVKNGPELCITARELLIDDILKISPDKSAAGKIGYLFARGNYQDVLPLMSGLQDEEKARWDRKVRLSIKGESGLVAQAAYENLAKAAESKNWVAFRKVLEDFEKEYGKTTVAEENVLKLIEWKTEAKEALDGLEATCNFQPEKWPMLNPCKIKVRDDPETGSKILIIEGEAGAGKTGNGDKSSFSCTDKKPLNLAGKTKLVLRARHDQTKPLRISLAFFNPESGLFESQAAMIPPDGWSDVTFRLDLPSFKSAKTLFLTNDQELTGKDAIRNVGFLVYSSDAYKLELDRIFFK